MSAHRPGSHTREIDLSALRAWVGAGRPPEGPRDWFHRTRPTARRRRATGRRVPYAGVLAMFVAVLLAVGATGIIAVMLEHRPAGYARPVPTRTQESATP